MTEPTWSLRRRLTLAVVGLVALVLIAFAAVLYVAVRRAAWHQHDAALVGRARALAAIAEHDDDGYEMEMPPEAVGEPAVYIQVWRPDGTTLARSGALGGRDLPRAASPTADLELSDAELPDGRAGRAVALRFVPRDSARLHPAAPVLLALAEGTEDVDAAVASARVAFAALGLLALVAIALVTRWSLARGLRPLAALASAIEAIDDRRLATRLPVTGQPLELATPVRKLNDLLGRLDASFARERQFTADVSHELRTPLSGLRTLLEVTAMAERDVPEYRATLAEALAMTIQLGDVVENLLSLARLDAGLVEIERRRVPLRDLVEECWRGHAAVARSRGLTFRNEIPADAAALTDREKLRIVISNLLANAAEYTDAGGWIEVTRDATGVIEVADSGPAIPEAELARIFDRMWRGDRARAATGVHCGIGLSLSRALCTTLALTLTATSRADGRVAFRIA